MTENLDRILENFDSQDPIKKRHLIEMIVARVIVHKQNKLELWIKKDFGRERASYSAMAEPGSEGSLNFSGNSQIARNGLSASPASKSSVTVEERSSSGDKLAGWTGLS